MITNYKYTSAITLVNVAIIIFLCYNYGALLLYVTPYVRFIIITL